MKRRTSAFSLFFILFLWIFPVPGCTRVTEEPLLSPAPVPSNSAAVEPLPAPGTDGTFFSTFYNGTCLSVTVSETLSEEVANRIFTDYAALSRELDSSDETSALFAFNNSGETAFSLTETQADMLAMGLRCSELTEGAFDLTSEPLRTLWDFSGEMLLLPTEETVSAALSYVNYQKISLTENTLTLENEGIQLNTADYFEGYAALRALQTLKTAGIGSAVLSFGNLTYYLGTDANQKPYTVTLTVPDGETVREIASVTVQDLAIAGAHCYEQYQEEEDGIYHPMFDLHTGYPSRQGFSSVFIFSSSPVLAQTAAKACYSLSVEQGKTMISNLPDTDALWVMEDGTLTLSDGFADRLPITELGNEEL